MAFSASVIVLEIYKKITHRRETMRASTVWGTFAFIWFATADLTYAAGNGDGARKGGPTSMQCSTRRQIFVSPGERGCVKACRAARNTGEAKGKNNNKGMFSAVSNKAALRECMHQYQGRRGPLKPAWVEECYHLKTGKYPWQ